MRGLLRVYLSPTGVGGGNLQPMAAGPQLSLVWSMWMSEPSDTSLALNGAGGGSTTGTPSVSAG